MGKMKTKADIDQAFYQQASSALQRSNLSATEFILRYPARSKKELAEILGSGTTSRGLTMVLFAEARQRSLLREVAQDLLFRKIVEEFPNGWFEDENIRPTVKLGGWRYDLLEFAPEFEESATAILKSLASTDKPNDGWKPLSPSDERLRTLFETHWAEL